MTKETERVVGHLMGLSEGTRLELSYGRCQKQKALNCGVHVIAMAVCFALRQKVSDTQFSHKQMRGHLFGWFENQQLTQFPGPDGKEKVGFTGNDNRIEIRIPKLWHKLVPIDVPSKTKPSSKKAKT